MMNYFDLSIPVRSLLILGLFLELCICGCLLPGVFRQKKSAPKMLLLSGMLLKDVKTWKVLVVFAVMHFVAQLLPQTLMILFSAGYSMFLHFYTRFFENIKLLMPLFMVASMIAPVSFTYIGMKVIGINKNDNRNKFANNNEQRH